MAKHYIDNSRFIEGIAEITDQIVSAQFGGSDKEDDGEGGTKYTEDAQDFFNEKYDEIEHIMNSVMGIHSSIEIE